MLADNAGIATIANGQTTSDAVDLGPRALLAIIMPATWTAADLTITAANSLAGTYHPVMRADGSTTAIAAYTIKAPSASDYIALNPSDFAALRYIKFVSSGAQAAERKLQLIGGILT
jgi:hypothetical protein